MARPLDEIRKLAKQYNVSVIYAGDIFDKWNAGPEIINFALDNLPEGYAVPGQHDLPNHNYDEIKRSAYWTLVGAGRITNLPPDETFNIKPYRNTELDLLATGFPWGYPPKATSPEPTAMRIAICHRYIWTNNYGYHGAPEEHRITSKTPLSFAGYDVAVFGDNHIGFDRSCKSLTICNCGSLMRRHTDQLNYRPSVGLLLSDGTVRRHYLDTSEDRFIETTAAEVAVEELLDTARLVAELRELEAGDALDFTEALKRFLRDNKVAARVAEIVLEATEGK